MDQACCKAALPVNPESGRLPHPTLAQSSLMEAVPLQHSREESRHAGRQRPFRGEREGMEILEVILPPVTQMSLLSQVIYRFKIISAKIPMAQK